MVATKKDAEYLIQAVNQMFPKINLNLTDIESSWAGLRPLIHEEGKDPSELSRKDEIFESPSGLISIAGGKLTGYRKMAQRINEVIEKRLGKKAKMDSSRTEHIALTSHAMRSSEEVEAYRIKLEKQLRNKGIKDSYIAWYLTHTFGKQATIILNRIDYFLNIDVYERLIRAEVWYTVSFEMAHSVIDYFVRRTGRLYFDMPSVKKYRSLVVEDFANYLAWDNARITLEEKQLDQTIKDATTFYTKEFD